MNHHSSSENKCKSKSNTLLRPILLVYFGLQDGMFVYILRSILSHENEYLD